MGQNIRAELWNNQDDFCKFYCFLRLDKNTFSVFCCVQTTHRGFHGDVRSANYGLFLGGIMKSKFAFAAAAAVIATAGAASAADFAAGNYLFTSTITAVSDVAGGAICAGFQQTVGTVGVSFATYTPATSSAAGSLLQLADAPNSIYSIAESIP